MKQLIIPDKVQKEMLADFMIMGETRGLIGGYCENEFPFYYANEEMALMLGYDAVEEMVEAIDGKVINSNFAYRFYLCTLKIQYLAGIRLSKFYPLPYAA